MKRMTKFDGWIFLFPGAKISRCNFKTKDYIFGVKFTIAFSWQKHLKLK